MRYYVDRSLQHTKTTLILPPWEDESHQTFLKECYHVKSQHTFENYFEGGILKSSVCDHLFAMADPDKSPGNPWFYTVSTNGDMNKHKAEFQLILSKRVSDLIDFGHELLQLFNTNKALFLKAFSYGLDSSLLMHEHTLISSELIKQGLVDPVALRVKGEPRAVGKRPRLVCMISLCDNLIDRLSIGDALVDEQDTPDLPIATKLDINTPAVTARMYSLFKENSPLQSNDVQGWEYSPRADMVLRSLVKFAYTLGLTDEKFNAFDLNINPRGCDELALLVARFYCYVHRVVCTVSGEMVTTPPGMVSSGLLCTFSKNSHERASLAYDCYYITKKTLNGKPLFIKTAGDDCLDNAVSPPFFYENRGYHLTDIEVQSGPFSFCSTTFTNKFAHQQNIAKFFVNVMYTTTAELFSEHLLAFDGSFRHHPEYSKYYDLLMSNSPPGWNTVDKEVRKVESLGYPAWADLCSNKDG